MKILVVGSGGREHALCWKLHTSPLVSALYAAPGNPGTAEFAQNVAIEVTDVDALCDFAVREDINLTVVGPELPLSLGLADALAARGLAVFGPVQDAARLESSKAFSKEIMNAAQVPTPQSWHTTSLNEARALTTKRGVPLVLKADGLASGKGVVVCHERAEVEVGLSYLFEQLGSDTVLVEEFIKGTEASFMVATDGSTIIPLATSHDYKRIGEGNTGANTGGMGSISPTPYLTTKQEEFALHGIITPVLQELKRRGIPFKGFLYAGLMIPADGSPRVIEFNVRLGDPECQSILRRLENDLLPTLCHLAGVKGYEEAPSALEWSASSAVCLVNASAGYPAASSSGDVIEGITAAKQNNDVVVFQAGTARAEDGTLVTAGGRVLGITATGETTEEALRVAYRASELVHFAGRQLRRDIGAPNG